MGFGVVFCIGFEGLIFCQNWNVMLFWFAAFIIRRYVYVDENVQDFE